MNVSKHKTELGEFYILDNDRWIGRTIKMGNALDADKIKLLLSYLDEHSVVLDIGANIGTHSIPYSKKAEKVIAFEPEVNNFRTLMHNIIIKDIRNSLLVESDFHIMSFGGECHLKCD